MEQGDISDGHRYLLPDFPLPLAVVPGHHSPCSPIHKIVLDNLDHWSAKTSDLFL